MIQTELPPAPSRPSRRAPPSLGALPLILTACARAAAADRIVAPPIAAAAPPPGGPTRLRRVRPPSAAAPPAGPPPGRAGARAFSSGAPIAEPPPPGPAALSGAGFTRELEQPFRSFALGPGPLVAALADEP